MNRRDLRSVARYFLNPTLPGLVNGHAVRVVDLSVKGARVELNDAIEPGEEVFFVVAAPAGEITVSGTVLWCQIDSLQIDLPQDRYLAGIAFAQTSAAMDEVIDQLCDREAAIRIEDSRNHDRYRMTAPLTGRFAETIRVSLLDLSVRGARISSDEKIGAGTEGVLRFQVDDEMGPAYVYAKVVWTTPAVNGGEHAGLIIENEEEILHHAIHRLCVRGEARIDLDSLRRKFDQLRAQSAVREAVG